MEISLGQIKLSDVTGGLEHILAKQPGKKLSVVLGKPSGDPDGMVVIQHNLWLQMFMDYAQKDESMRVQDPAASGVFLLPWFNHLNPTAQIWEEQRFWTTHLLPTVTPSQTNPLDLQTPQPPVLQLTQPLQNGRRWGGHRQIHPARYIDTDTASSEKCQICGRKVVPCDKIWVQINSKL